MYSPVAISDARRLAATPYRLFGARRPVARVCHPPGSPPQRWSIHTGAVSRQCSSAGFSHAVKTPSCPIACQSVRLTTCVVLFDADQSDVRGGIMGLHVEALPRMLLFPTALFPAATAGQPSPRGPSNPSTLACVDVVWHGSHDPPLAAPDSTPLRPARCFDCRLLGVRPMSSPCPRAAAQVL